MPANVNLEYARTESSDKTTTASEIEVPQNGSKKTAVEVPRKQRTSGGRTVRKVGQEQKRMVVHHRLRLMRNRTK